MTGKSAVSTLLRFSGSLCCLGLLGSGIYWSLRIGYADFVARQSPIGIIRARELVPIRADYWGTLPAGAAVTEKDRQKSLETAARLNPTDAQPWLDLGLDAELAGDYSRAEQDLLHAAQINKQFAARWTLANYYFRRHDDRFWIWMKQALLVSYGDRTALFRLCWSFSDNPDVILSQAIPDRNTILGPYLSFLLAANKVADAEACARRMLPRARDEDVPALLQFCGLLLQTGRVLPAVSIWNSLSLRKLLPYTPILPQTGGTLTNAEFRHEPFLGAFDWRLTQAEGIHAQVLGTDLGLKVSFSGKQPETCEVLTQFLAVEPSRKYELQFVYRTSTSAASDTGLEWKVLDSSGSALPAHLPKLFSDDWKQEKLDFTTGPNTRLVRLALVYTRAPGTTRFEGAVTLRKLAMGFAS